MTQVQILPNGSWIIKNIMIDTKKATQLTEWLQTT